MVGKGLVPFLNAEAVENKKKQLDIKDEEV
jgi:hypothetical protein